MALVRQFRALRPRPDLAAEMAAVPYDVVSVEEARALAQGKPNSLLLKSAGQFAWAGVKIPEVPLVQCCGTRCSFASTHAILALQLSCTWA